MARAEGELQRRRSALSAGGADPFVRDREAALGVREERETGLGEPDGAGRPREERDTELVLELLDALAERGGGERDALRRLREPEEPGGGEEAPEVVATGW